MKNQTTPQILIVDDDEAICKTLSAIIQAEGYKTVRATTAKEAIEKTKTKFFNLALLDIKLSDMTGTKLLAQLQKTTPETIKIMITGYPSLQNAVEALNLGADSYMMKPINPAELLKTIKNKLEAKQQAEKINKEKLAYWIQSQIRKKQLPNFQEFLEETANELKNFGLTKTQAKIYITLTALGIASASEIAALSKIRREEIYRIMPKLENHGLVIKKLKSPRKFSAIQPEKAIQLLTKAKLKAMKEEIEKLGQKQAHLIPKLKTIELPIQRDDHSIGVISNTDHLIIRLIDMVNNARRQIQVMTSLENLKYGYMNYSKKLKEKLRKPIKMRIITEIHEPDAFTEEITQFSLTNNQMELRQVEKLPFNLMIVDDNEAVWGKTRLKTENLHSLWTNDPTQINILKTSFESLWKKSSSIRKLNIEKSTPLK